MTGNAGSLALWALILLAHVIPAPAQEASRFKLSTTKGDGASAGGQMPAVLSGLAVEVLCKALVAVLPAEGCSCREGSGLVMHLHETSPGAVDAIFPGVGGGEGILARSVLAEGRADEAHGRMLEKRASEQDRRLIAKLIVGGHISSQRGRHQDALTLLTLVRVQSSVLLVSLDAREEGFK